MKEKAEVILSPYASRRLIANAFEFVKSIKSEKPLARPNGEPVQ